MKNIHIIPTNLPSRLFLNVVNNKLLIDNDYNLNKVLPSGKHQNIYITNTNSKKIKEGWYFNNSTGVNKPVFVQSEIITGLRQFHGDNPSHLERIILTDDIDLVDDGVQPIDDNFLRWFIQNPTCEYIEVESKMIIEYEPLGHAGGVYNHKIIFPKKETKQ